MMPYAFLNVQRFVCVFGFSRHFGCVVSSHFETPVSFSLGLGDLGFQLVLFQNRSVCFFQFVT